MKPLLASLALAIVLAPTYAFSVERYRTMLFFSFEELREIISRLSSQQFIPPLTFQFQGEDDQDSRMEHEYRWGNGFGINRSAFPDMLRRPLWGY